MTEKKLRRAALDYSVPIVTTLAGARAAVEGINSLQKTERFFGCDITIPRKLLEILPPDVFYFYDLIGITVFNQDFVEIGILKDILKTGANDVYVIQPKSGKEILIPAIKEVVKKVDLENEKMYVVLRDGIE